MKLKRYVNGAWAVVDKELKQLTTATDSAASPISIIAPLAEPFDNYRIYGTSSGCGVETNNLFDENAKDTANGYVENAALRATGSVASSDTNDVSEYISILPSTNYCIIARRVNTAAVCFYDSSKQYISGIAYQNRRPFNFTSPEGAAYARMTSTRYSTGDMFLQGSYEEEPSYIPNGYKIPLTITSGAQSTTTPVYIGSSKLYEDEYLDYQEQKIYKDVSGTLTPTDPPVPFEAIQHYAGESTISVDTTVAPDKLELTYQGWRVAANPEPKFYHNGQWMTEYRRVEYIKSDGNPYIVTDIVGLNATTDYIEAEMSFGALSQLDDGTCLFGCATVDSGHWTAFGVLGYAYTAVANVRNNRFQFYPNYSTGGSGTIKRMSCVTNNDYSSKLLLSLKTPQATIINTSTSTTYTPTILDPDEDAATLQPIDFTQLAKFCVFAGQFYRGENDVVYYRCGRETSCYKISIYRNNILTHNLIPVERQIDGVLGLYDTITDTFYTNSGTGTFVKGGYI